jgi:hypothetical protein
MPGKGLGIVRKVSFLSQINCLLPGKVINYTPSVNRYKGRNNICNKQGFCRYFFAGILFGNFKYLSYL